MVNDTIAAISTSAGEAGIGIIRLSGTDALDIVDKIYIDKNEKHSLLSYKSHSIHYGFIIDENSSVIDEVMISIMKAPNSYTKENVVEINCHGGIRICKKILDTVILSGARIADPGEFTKRAFLNGRLDLTRAEAVMDTIRANSDAALKTSVSHLRGSLYNKLNNICSEILYEIAFIESALDDPDSISLDGYNNRLVEKTSSFINEINDLIKSYDEGRIIAEGINTVIIGKPNAGKSSLLNVLMDEERAIVTNIPGTTRDTLTEIVRIDDITLRLTDTAGIRQTDDPIENIGVDKAKKSVEDADLIIYVCDSSSELNDDDKKILLECNNKNIIVLLNKDDLGSVISKAKIKDFLDTIDVEVIDIISSSMKTNKGIDELKTIIKNLFYTGNLESTENVIITNLRHVQYLRDSVQSLQKVLQSIDDNMSEDFYAIDLTDAYSALSKITGSEVSEDIVNEIFSKFCMGK